MGLKVKIVAIQKSPESWFRKHETHLTAKHFGEKSNISRYLMDSKNFFAKIVKYLNSRIWKFYSIRIYM
ncbi:hypothetical protein QNI22_05370 [Cytophagaceae bacterium BD1B2-1]|uniref:Uncharacterized protein n=1 Tax=Xanthocytophaga agilis TaxID=3048010 RepID=A0AAE3QXY4_9BACT|nr:hypothetical protein [Xanthocytophaga agilis]